MVMGILNSVLSNFFFLALHVDSRNIFPKPLSKKEEEMYFRLMAEGDECARHKLIEHNLRLVAHIIKKYYSNSDDQDELISIGTIGLIKGINSFKSDKNIRLATYAARCIENEILMFFRSNKKYANDISLNDYIGIDKDGNEISLIDVIPSSDEDLTTTIFKNMNIELLHEYLSILNEREKDIIIKRYGLYNSDIYTQKDVAALLNISRSYVSRIEKRALSKLYKEFYKKQKKGSISTPYNHSQ